MYRHDNFLELPENNFSLSTILIRDEKEVVNCGSNKAFISRLGIYLPIEKPLSRGGITCHQFMYLMFGVDPRRDDEISSFRSTFYQSKPDNAYRFLSPVILLNLCNKPVHSAIHLSRDVWLSKLGRHGLVATSLSELIRHYNSASVYTSDLQLM